MVTCPPEPLWQRRLKRRLCDGYTRTTANRDLQLIPFFLYIFISVFYFLSMNPFHPSPPHLSLSPSVLPPSRPLNLPTFLPLPDSLIVHPSLFPVLPITPPLPLFRPLSGIHLCCIRQDMLSEKAREDRKKEDVENG